MRPWLTILALVCISPLAAGLEPPEPSEAARKVAEEIRAEALLPPDGPEGRPLPLASHWNMGEFPGSFEPSHQIELLQQGHRILPWMSEPIGDPDDDGFQAYYKPLVSYITKLELPFSMRGTQWEAMLYGEEYRDEPDDRWAGVITPDGERRNRLSPFGPVELWEDPAERYVDSEAMRWLQTAYPEPPLVLWTGNNEAQRLRWHEAEESKRYLEEHGEARSDSFKRRMVAEGWAERYGAMFEAMRDAMDEQAWRQNLRFIGYEAFGPTPMGRWDGWKNYSLHTEDGMAWEWHVWDGATPSYYTHDWNDNRDHWVWSTQVQSMNWLFMVEQALEANPGFWFEISTWDGNTRHPDLWKEALGLEEPADLPEQASQPLDDEQQERAERLIEDDGQYIPKALTYMRDGQTYPPERALGWIQYGMWLLRPRVVREYRCHTTQLEPFKKYWLQVVQAVDTVWENETLREFWRHGELVPNTAQRHPYQANIPNHLDDVPRWFLLETDRDPERPWDLQTDIPVFSLALKLPPPDESAGTPRWLVYAHSPLKDRTDVRITVPGFGAITVDTPRAGAFYLLDETAEETVTELLS